MKRKSKASKPSKNGASSRGSQNKKRKTEKQVIPKKSTAKHQSKAERPEPENDTVDRTNRNRTTKKSIPKKEATKSGNGSGKVAAEDKKEKTKSSIQQRNARDKSTNQSKTAKTGANGEKVDSSNRRSKPVSSDMVPTRRSRRSEGGAPELVSLSYIYPGKMDWDSFRNCWVKKGTAMKLKPDERITVATPEKESPPPAAEKNNDPEKNDDVPIETTNDDAQPITKDDEKDKGSKVSPATEETKKETKEIEKKPPLMKDAIADQFDDPVEEDGSVEVFSDIDEPKDDDEKIDHASDKQSPSITGIQDLDSVVDKDTPASPEVQETIVVNPADVNVNDFCYVCRLDGDLMECYAELENGQEFGCGKSIHIGCIGRSKLPDGDWLCSQCAKKQGLPINPSEHAQYGYAFGEDEFEIEIGGSLQKMSLGSRIAIYWQDDNQYYNATVLNHNGGSNVQVLYDDGVRENLDLSVEKSKLLRNDSTGSGSRERPRNVNEERKIALLGLNDIVVGRGDSQTNWAKQHGYYEFRKLLNTYHGEYQSLSNGDSSVRRALCKKVYAVLSRSGLRFVSWDGNAWNQLSFGKSVDKVNQGLRDFRGAGSAVDENGVDERGLRWNDVPLGYSTKKGLAYRPGYRILRKIVQSMQAEFKATQDRRRVCLKVLDQLRRENVRIVQIVKNVKEEGGDDWVVVEEEKAIRRVLRAFREEDGEPGRYQYQPFVKPQGLMPSQQIALPPLVSKKERDRPRPRAKNRSRKRLPTSSTLDVDNRHPLIREDPNSKRVVVEIDPAFLVQSDSDDSQASGTSDDSSSESSMDSAMNQIDLFDEDMENASIKPALVNLCSKIRGSHLSREERPTSSSFDPASGRESFNYYYQPSPLHRKTKLSYQHDMICDLIYSGTGKPPKPAAHLTRYASISAVPKRSSAVAAPGFAWSSPSPKKSKGQRAAKTVTPPLMYLNRPPSTQATAGRVSIVPPRFSGKSYQLQGQLTEAASAELAAIAALPRNRSNTGKRLGRPPGAANKKPKKSKSPAYAGPPKKGKRRKRSEASKSKEDSIRFRTFQIEVWTARLQEAQEFRKTHGHCIIPYDYPPNQELARWAQRQRYQYQLFKTKSSKSYMTKERVEALQSLGFCWEPNSSVWYQRYKELKEFIKEHGHTLVPSGYKNNRKLATWVKSQRRQMQLLQKGDPNNLTDERVNLLNAVQFAWIGNVDNIPASQLGSLQDAEKDETYDENEDFGEDMEEEAVPPGPAGMGLEERKIRAKYRKKQGTPGEIGEEERKIRAKYMKQATATGATTTTAASSGTSAMLGEEERKIRAKYKRDDGTTSIGEEERKIRAKYGNNKQGGSSTISTATSAGEIGEEERKIRAKYLGS